MSTGEAHVRTLEQTPLKILQTARMCHEVNRAYCEAMGDTSQLPWNDAPQWQRDSAAKGVEFVIANPNAPPSANHENWLEEKKRDGWKYGAVKDAEKKEHPCFVSYEKLPREQQVKDYLFKGVVLAMA